MSARKHLKDTGNKGEKIAEEFLIKKGYLILERNYRYKRSEIDLIAQLTDFLIFIEVKTRRSSHFGSPEEAVSSNKMNKIKEAAEEYIFQKGWQKDIRFDVIAVSIGASYSIEHFEDISC